MKAGSFVLLPAMALLATAFLAAPALASRRPDPAVARGLAFATAHCSSCHAVTANGTSANPEAPPWDDVANRPGLTRQTFASFLADSHNFPEAMEFTVDRRAIGDLAAYLLTLRKPGYRPTR